jgi:hypothetical protein
MTSWHPLTDLTRLLEALAKEVVTATEQDVRQAYGQDGHSVRATAKEVSRMIFASDRIDLDDPDENIALIEPTMSREPPHKQH